MGTPDSYESNPTVKRTEAETLATFQEEIPSIYFSHKGEEEYANYVKRAEFIYREHFKFPPKMFEGAKLIDFGAGTGENTIYLANWGASCTLVEMNELAQKISKEVFSKYAIRPNEHTFVHSSIFDYAPEKKELFDIVHCRGVLSHTAAKEDAFQKIATFLRPGGFLIFGDPNKAGGFQNMLQRYAVYKYAKTPDEMVDVSELLFKEDIDRSEQTIPRTRRAIIFDRWVIQCQDDPSVAEVVYWIQKAGLRMYSSYPSVLPPTLGDSLHHNPKFDPYGLKNVFSVAELTWMMQTESDKNFMQAVDAGVGALADSHAKITSYVANLNKGTSLKLDDFSALVRKLVSSMDETRLLQPVREKLVIFAKEAEEFLRIVNTGDLKAVRKFIEGTRHLFRGACGNRHVDFIAYKPNE
jgi:2-polyprenyl-3-methyl-5-hydroxy-6-metoxy-1,4-benzoquinol methylase